MYWQKIVYFYVGNFYVDIIKKSDSIFMIILLQTVLHNGGNLIKIPDIFKIKNTDKNFIL